METPTAELTALVREPYLSFAIAQREGLAYGDAAVRAGVPGRGLELMAHPATQLAHRMLSGAPHEQEAERVSLITGMCWRMLQGDIADVVDAAGTVLPMPQWSVDMRLLVTSYEIKPDGSPRVRLERRIEVAKTLLATYGDEGERKAVQEDVHVHFHGRGK